MRDAPRPPAADPGAVDRSSGLGATDNRNDTTQGIEMLRTLASLMAEVAESPMAFVHAGPHTRSETARAIGAASELTTFCGVSVVPRHREDIADLPRCPTCAAGRDGVRFVWERVMGSLQ